MFYCCKKGISHLQSHCCTEYEKTVMIQYNNHTCMLYAFQRRQFEGLSSGKNSSLQVITLDLKAHFSSVMLKLFSCEITITLPALKLRQTLHLH